MRLDEIRANKPEGATHYRIADYGTHNIKYYAMFNSVWHFKSYDGSWYISKYVTSVNQIKPL